MRGMWSAGSRPGKEKEAARKRIFQEIMMERAKKRREQGVESGKSVNMYIVFFFFHDKINLALLNTVFI